MNEQPLQLFASWLAQAHASEEQAERMALATVGPDGMPSVRMVLLKQVDDQGFVFYTNLTSQKAKHLMVNSQAALCFYWPSQEKQVRVQGKVSPVSSEEADAYFQTRPRGSQISAWVSEQSATLADYQVLQHKAEAFEAKHRGQSLARPDFWSGFRLVPSAIEFWQAGEHRLHRRTHYCKQQDGWCKTLLQP